MQIGVTHLVVPQMPYAEFFREAAAAGYEVVEIDMRQQGELTPHTSETDLKQIAAQAKSAGVKIVSMCHLHVTGNLLDGGDPQKLGIEESIAGLRAAKIMGIDCTLHTLGRQRPDLYYDDAYRNTVRALKQLAPVCRDLNVSLAYEFTWSGFLFSPMEIRRLLDEVNSPHIGFYFDPGNMAVFQYPHHWVRIIGHHIKRVHLKDWKGNALNGGWPPLLKGTVDYAAMNRELRAIGYDGPMISEVPLSDASLEETAQSIRKIIAM
jgi:L-ribulose-5-phosphate 3-epimerase